MATNKSVTPAEVDQAPSYGKKSEPPRKVVKDMSSKQEEPSSKDELHGANQKPKTKK